MSNFFPLIQTPLPSQARFESLNMAAFQMQLSKFVTPAYRGVNSLPFFFIHLLILTLLDGVSWLYWNIMNTQMVLCATKKKKNPERFHRILEWVLFFSSPPPETSKVTIISLSLSVKTAIFTRLKSLLKPRDKSCSARHKSHCQKKASLSPSLSICGPLALYLLALVSLPLLKRFIWGKGR